MHDDVDSRSYAVVVNEAEQYSVWLADRQLPSGWRLAGFTAPSPNAWLISTRCGPTCARVDRCRTADDDGAVSRCPFARRPRPELTP